VKYPQQRAWTRALPARIILRTMAARKNLLNALAALFCAGWVLAFLAFGAGPRRRVRPVPNGARPPANNRNGAEPLKEFARRLPESTRFLLATDNLKELAGELRAGPAGRIATAPSVKRFLAALEREPAGESGTVIEAVKLGLELAPDAGGPAALVMWDLAGKRGPALGFIARVAPDKSAGCLKALGSALTATGQKPRRLSAGLGETLLTLAPEGRDGAAWGSSGDWIVISDRVAGCRELLELVAWGDLRAAPKRIAAALSAAGPGRLAGFFETGGLVGPRPAAALGLKAVDWAGYSAQPEKSGRWTETLVLAGKPSGGGVPAGLAPGGARRMLAGLPEAALVAVSFNVADGARLWRELLEAIRPLDRRGLIPYAARRLGAAAGKDFERDFASHVRGEVTVAWMLPRQGMFPQALIGVDLAEGAADRLRAGTDRVLELPYFGGGGEVKSGEYRGVRLAWLADQEVYNRFAPSPAYCFKGDRLLSASSTVHLKEHLAGRGRKWFSRDEVTRLSSGLLGARVSLERSMFVTWGAATLGGAWKRLGEEARRNLPMQEEVGRPLGELEMVVGKCPQGLEVKIRSPLPVGAAAAAALLLVE